MNFVGRCYEAKRICCSVHYTLDQPWYLLVRYRTIQYFVNCRNHRKTIQKISTQNSKRTNLLFRLFSFTTLEATRSASTPIRIASMLKSKVNTWIQLICRWRGLKESRLLDFGLPVPVSKTFSILTGWLVFDTYATFWLKRAFVTLLSSYSWPFSSVLQTGLSYAIPENRRRCRFEYAWFVSRVWFFIFVHSGTLLISSTSMSHVSLGTIFGISASASSCCCTAVINLYFGLLYVDKVSCGQFACYMEGTLVFWLRRFMYLSYHHGVSLRRQVTARITTMTFVNFNAEGATKQV